MRKVTACLTTLVSADPDGKITVRGKEPRILIDNKPVSLNGLQLTDFLESLPGGMIDKIEVMTNPPAQYANEAGGVINITTRKGKIGVSARLVTYGGSRGELGSNASINFRRTKLFQNETIGCSVGCIYQGLDENKYVICDCSASGSAEISNTGSKDSLSSIPPMNYDIALCYYETYDDVN